VAHGDRLLLCLEDFLPEECPACLDPFALQEFLPGDPLNQLTDQSKV